MKIILLAALGVTFLLRGEQVLAEEMNYSKKTTLPSDKIAASSPQSRESRKVAQAGDPVLFTCVAPAAEYTFKFGDIVLTSETSSLNGIKYYNPVFPGRPLAEIAKLSAKEVEGYFGEKFDGIYRIGLSVAGTYGNYLPKEITTNPKKYFFEPIFRSLTAQGVDQKKIEIMMFLGEGKVTTLKKRKDLTKEEIEQGVGKSCSTHGAEVDYRLSAYWSQAVKQLIYKVYTHDDYVNPPVEKLGYLKMYDTALCHVKLEQMCDEYRQPYPEKQ